MSQLQKIVKLTKAQYNTLTTSANHTISYSGGTHTYSDNNLYFITDEAVSATDLGDDFILPVNKGGTGKTQFTSGSLLVGNGQNALTEIGATNQNTANTIIKRDGNGNFSAGTITASLSGNATTASRLQGFSSSGTSNVTWGTANSIGTQVCWANDASGGSYSFRRDNPVAGELSLILDGTVYIKEGNQNVSEAVKSFSVSGQTVTYTTLWGNTGTFTTQDTNKYHKTGSWGGTNNLTYTASPVNSADALAFTLATASTSAYGATKLYDGVDSTSTTLAATANAVKTAYDQANGIVAAANAMVFKGTRNGAATSSNGGAGGLTPSADCGDTYKVAIAGYINGSPVEVGDIIICTTDGTEASTSSNYSTIKENWVIVQNNIDGSIFYGNNTLSSGQYLVTDGANGKVKSQALPTASTTTAGITKVGAAGGAAAFAHGDHVSTDTVKAALGASSSGSATKYLNEKGSFVSIAASDVGASASNHTHDITLADNGTSPTALSAGSTYTLTAGGKSLAFTTPADVKVKQTSNGTSKAYKVLFSTTDSPSSGTAYETYYGSLTYNPNTKALVTGGTVDGYTLAAASARAVDSTISAASTSTNLPTSAAVASFVEGKGYITTDTNTASAVSNILEGSNNNTAITYKPYTTQQSSLSFDTSNSAPSLTTRLNLNGYLYATKLYSGGTEVSVSGHSHNYAGSGSAGGAANSANALNFVHTNEILIGNTNAQAAIHINHRRVSGGATSGNTAITDYYFKNGNGATTGVTVHAATFDGTVTNATNATNASNLGVKLATTSTAYLIGTTTKVTSATTASNVAAVSDTGVYFTSTAGQLSATSFSINDGTNQTVSLQWDTDDQAIKFVFV